MQAMMKVFVYNTDAISDWEKLIDFFKYTNGATVVIRLLYQRKIIINEVLITHDFTSREKNPGQIFNSKS